MKRKLQITTTASVASLIAFTMLAQDTPNAKTGGTESAPERSARVTRSELLGRPDKVSDLIGTIVRNAQGDKLGKVEDLALDLETGRIVEVILSTGGVLGLAVMLVPVPPGALRYDAGSQVIHLASDRNKLKAAPRFGMSNWATLGQSNEVAETYRYLGQEPYFAAIHQPTLGPDPTARLGYVQRATKLAGVLVKNVQNEKLGKVEHLMVDLPAGRVVSVMLASGGFLGLGEELSAVPPAAFQFNSEHKHLELDISKEALRNAPHFKASEWPDLGDPIYAGRFYRAYRIEPYFTTNATITAGNRLPAK